jgi:hypothetical protein
MTSTGVITQGGSTFFVKGSHNYFDEGTYTIHVTLGDDNAPTVTVTSTAIIADANLTGTPKTLSITAGAPFNGVVAHFTDANPNAVVGEFTATIRWDASTTTTGMVVVSGSGFDVVGSNTYVIAGTQTVVVTIHDVGGKTLKVNSTATITNSNRTVQPGESAKIDFWNSTNGQTLINSFGGSSSSTALATWLATNFSNLFGAGAGSHNLTGQTNVQVAALFQTLFSASAPKVEAEAMATALNVYATTLSLGGTTASSFGFLVTANGLGADDFNVGANGTAFALANNQSYNVFRLLREINFKTVGGTIWPGNTLMRSEAFNVFDGINILGGL